MGRGGLQVSAIGPGCMGMSSNCGEPEDRQAMITPIHAAVERGVTFLDTAQVAVTYLLVQFTNHVTTYKARGR